MKLKQTNKCPNCGAFIDTRKYVPDGYIRDCEGIRYQLYYEQKYIKCKYCRGEFELCGEGEE